MKVLRWSFALALTGLATVACSDSTSSGTPPPVPLDSLNVVRLAAIAPPQLCQDTLSFWAKAGQQVDTALVFPEPGDACPNGEDFLRLKLDQQSLLKYPDGTAFQPGDSVLITMTWVGSDSILFHLEPTGLQFDPAHPAALKIEYGETGGDLNHDNKVDSLDVEVEHIIGIWRQPTLADPFTQIQSVKLEDFDEIEAKLNGFSRYALAY